jgi:hypothetical protein
LFDEAQIKRLIPGTHFRFLHNSIAFDVGHGGLSPFGIREKPPFIAFVETKEYHTQNN